VGYINYGVLVFKYRMIRTTVITLFLLSLTVVFACDAGYEGNSTIGDCTPCRVTTYKNEIGDGSCMACQANSENGIEGERQCYCSLGFSHNVDGVCTQCADCSFRVEFQINVDIPDPVLKDKIPYVLAFFSHAFAVAPSAIKIVKETPSARYSTFQTKVTGTSQTISSVSAKVVSDAFKSALFDEFKPVGLTTEPRIYIFRQRVDNSMADLIMALSIFGGVTVFVLGFIYVVKKDKPVSAKKPDTLGAGGILADTRIDLVGPYRELTNYA
jgi:hypothetical protein